MSTIFALAAALLLITPIFSLVPVRDAEAITSSLFVSLSVKNIDGKAVQQLNAGQQATVSVRVLNHEVSDQPFTAVIDVRDDSDVSIHIAWLSGVARSASHFDVELPWLAQEAGSYKVRTFILTDMEKPEVISKVSSSQFMVTNNDILKDSFVPGNLTGISKFDVVPSGSQYKVWFTLIDQNGDQATYDGKVMFKITDSLGELRYTEIIPVKKSDFILFNPNKQAAPVIAYVWRFDTLDVSRGLGAGTASLTFTSSDGKSYSSKVGPIEIHQAYGNELAQIYELQYDKSAIVVGKSIIEGNFKITLDKAGRFTHPVNGTYGDEVTHYRADFVIENVGATVDSWPSQYLIVDDKSNEYTETSDGSLHAGDTIPGYSKLRGYVLFEDISETASWIKLILRGNDPADVFEFTVGL